MESICLRVSITVAGFAIATGALSSSCPAQQHVQHPHWAEQLQQLLRESKIDEAIKIVRLEASQAEPDAQLPMTMVHVADVAMASGRIETSLELYGEVTKRFPRTPAAALATCGQGFALHKQGKHNESVVAWERGVAYCGAIAPPDLVDHLGLHNSSWHALGEHYVKTRQWSKGRRAFLKWRPLGIGCGNGFDDYLSTRAHNILLCQTHAGPPTATARDAWQALGCGLFQGPHDIPPFILVRLYAEADQLDDLERLAANAWDATPASSKPLPVSLLGRRAAAILAGIELARSRRWSDHVAAFDGFDRSKPQPLDDDVRRHVAAWILLREQDETASAVASGARKNKEVGGDLLAELLVNMTTPGAKEALGRLSRNTTSARRKLINDLTRERDTKLKKNRSNSSATENTRNRGPTRSRLPLLFYEPWPAIEPGSLPKSLPAELIAENKR